MMQNNCSIENKFISTVNDNEKLTELKLIDAKSSTKLLKIGSRDSELAMRQTHIVRDNLKYFHPFLTFKISSMKTQGDKRLDVPLSKIGSKSLFTKELEEHLLDKRVDIVVHSLKDLPTTLPDGLVIGCVTAREDPADAVILHPKHKALKGLQDLPENSVIGTSSLRRVAQLKRQYPKLKFDSIRGNLNTRLAKLDNADHYSAIVLAAAGITRMGWKDRISQYLNSDDCMYAVGQGALAIECREDDDEMLALLAPLNDFNTLFAVSAERSLMRALEGGCSVPLAVDCQINDGNITMKAGVWSLDGSEEIVQSLSACFETDNEHSNGESSQCAKVARICPKLRCGLYAPRSSLRKLNFAHRLGIQLADKLLALGAKRLLDEARAANITPPNAPPVKIKELNKNVLVQELKKNGIVKEMIVNCTEKVLLANGADEHRS